MKTFTGRIQSDFRIVVPQQFLEGLRRDAKLEGAVFLKIADQAHPENDDAFLAMVLKNGMRQFLKANMLELLANSGLGGSVSPATVEIIEVPHEGDFHAEVSPQVVNVREVLAAPYLCEDEGCPQSHIKHVCVNDQPTGEQL